MQPLRFLALAALVLGAGASRTASAFPPSDQPSPGRAGIRLAGGRTFEVHGLSPKEIQALARVKAGEAFTVRVAADEDKGAADRPAVLGSYQVTDGVLQFRPRFPLEPGVRYRAVYEPAKLGAEGKAVRQDFVVPRKNTTPSTVVEQVYPTADQLPENQLKFYLHFSAPMSRGEAYDRVRLLDAKGKEVEFPFLELGEELWDPAGQRFTLFFDPGRIKRGLKPREEVGPALEEGKRYTLVIDRGWTDAEGLPLKAGFKKEFAVGPPDDRQPDTRTWKVRPPQAGTRTPLVVTFPEPLDHALLERLLRVVGADGADIPGGVKIADRETRWEFTPEKPWAAGAYALRAGTVLEDLAGNNLARPFEVDVFRPVERATKAQTVQVPFRVEERGRQGEGR